MAFQVVVDGNFGPDSRAHVMEILSDFYATKITGGKGKEPVGGKFRAVIWACNCASFILRHRALKSIRPRVSIQEI